MGQDLSPTGAPQGFAAVADRLVEHLASTTDVELWIVSRRVGGEYHVIAVRDRHYGITAGAVTPWGKTFCSRTATGLAPVWANDISVYPAWLAAREETGMDVRSYLSCTLRADDGTVLGSLCAASPAHRGTTFAANQVVIELAADVLALQLRTDLELESSVRALEAVRRDATTDALTGLANRRAWDEALVAEDARHRRNGGPAGVVVIDCDQLKAINDTQGHLAGDLLLRLVAEELLAVARPTSVVARLGGDEFAVLCPDATTDEVATLAGAVTDRLAAAGVEASIGWAMGRAGHDLAVAWADADLAMFDDKRRRRADDADTDTDTDDSPATPSLTSPA